MKIAQTGLILLFLACTACSTIPFKPTELAPTQPTTAAALAAGIWTAGPGIYLVRQSALFQFQGMRIPMAGLMKLDTVKKTARVVGMNDMGVKLFEVTVERTGSETHFVMEELARYPKFPEAIAASVRRMFLDPEPSPADLLTIRPDRYLLDRVRDGETIRFVFGGQDRQLLEKSATGPAGAWRVGYYEHLQRGPAAVPAGVVLEDHRSGYRLTLWIERVEPTDE